MHPNSMRAEVRALYRSGSMSRATARRLDTLEALLGINLDTARGLRTAKQLARWVWRRRVIDRPYDHASRSIEGLDMARAIVGYHVPSYPPRVTIEDTARALIDIARKAGF